MRQSKASFAVFTKKEKGQNLFLTKWNSNWNHFNLVGGHLEELTKIEVQESTIIGANSMRLVFKPSTARRIIAPTKLNI